MSGRFRLRTFFILFLTTFFIFSFTKLGIASADMFSGNFHSFEEGTTVATVPIENLSQEEARQRLEQRAEQWRTKNPVTLQLDNKELVFPESFIQFDIEATTDKVAAGEQTAFVTTIDRSYIEDIANEMGHEKFDRVSIDEFIHDIEAKASVLAEEDLSFSIYNYGDADAEVLQETVGEHSVELPGNVKTDLLIEQLHDQVIKGERAFSVLDHIDLMHVDSHAISPLATAIYGAVLETNFVIQERHISHKLPGYAEVGMEAKVEPQTGRDLVVANPNPYDYRLSIVKEGNEVTVKVKGFPLEQETSVAVQSQEQLDPDTVVHYSAFLDKGEVEEKQAGKQGHAVDVVRYTQTKEGQTDTLISEDYYPPVPRIELHSIAAKEDTSSADREEAPDKPSESPDKRQGESEDQHPSIPDEGAVDQDEDPDENQRSQDLWEKDAPVFK
ncbi:VanW family protein [Thalassobacillus sp. CUG 92003]|uniref:VanW family protein n=1 Tax=Thalassobacillus sp. CUG 92003 TaxID=2736641 RepID=UPI0015E63D31|nr:VanW family protein [Thalassobacillus sp. CUG 92003]